MSVQESIIIPKYGMPTAAYESKYCTLWDITKNFPELSHVVVGVVNPPAPLTRIEINVDFKAKWMVAIPQLITAGLIGQLLTFDGCMEHRTTRGSNVPSLHSWGLATDWNAAHNQLQFHHVDNPFEHSTFTKPFIDIIIASGMYWGGYYQNRFDPMHISCYNG